MDCSACGAADYSNPIPVSLAVTPVYDERPTEYGLLMIIRATDPGMGKFAFPGGNQDTGESSEAAAGREEIEEVRIATNVDLYVPFASIYSPKQNRQMTFWLTPAVHVSELGAFVPNPEASEFRVLHEMPSLGSIAFESHAAVMKRFFTLSLNDLQTIRLFLGGPPHV